MLQVPVVVLLVVLAVSVPAIVCAEEKPVRTIIVRNMQ
jgi:hypothetical protein